MAVRGSLYLLTAICSLCRGDDSVSLVQNAVQVHQQWQGRALQGGDMGMNMQEIPASNLKIVDDHFHSLHTKVSQPSGPPVPLVQAASQFNIPALGGLETLTKAVIGFKLWHVEDGMHRTFESADNSGFNMFGTRAMMDTVKGRAELYDKSTGKSMAVIQMANVDAAIRKKKPLTSLQKKLLGVSYFVYSYKPVCAGQAPIEREGVNSIYGFAKVSKTTGMDRWTVKRIACDTANGNIGAKWNVAYVLAHHGMETSMDAVAPNVGVIGTIDTVLDKEKQQTRQDAWLTTGEDPALFAAAVMISKMPSDVSPVESNYEAPAGPIVQTTRDTQQLAQGAFKFAGNAGKAAWDSVLRAKAAAKSLSR